MTKHKNIFLIGPTGAGKTTIGRLLAQELSLEFYDSDQEIVNRAGADIQWLFDVEGEEGFRRREEQIIADLTDLSGIVLATGGGAILSSDNRKMLVARGTVIYLQVSLDEQYARVEHSKDRPLLKTDNLLLTLQQMQQERESLYEQIADYTFSNAALNARTIAQEIIAKLGKSMIVS